MYVCVSVDKYVGQWTRHERESNFKLFSSTVYLELVLKCLNNTSQTHFRIIFILQVIIKQQICKHCQPARNT